VQRVLLVATLLGLFSEIATIHTAIQLRLIYAIVLACLPVVLWVWDFKLSFGYVVFIAYLWIDGIASVPLLGDNPKRVLMECAGVTCMSLYFLLFYRYQRWTMPEMFDMYATLAFWVCVAAFPISLIESVHSGEFVRFRSIGTEPAHYCGIVLPGFFYYASRFRTDRRAPLRAAVMFIAIVGADSSVGYIFLFLSFFVLARRHRIAAAVLPIVLIPAALSIYFISDSVRLRVDDTFSAVYALDVANTNYSTYALLSNVYVTVRSFQEHPIFGTGFGSYKVTHDRFIGQVPGMETFIGGFAYELNDEEANSLFLRITTELGLVGLLGVVFLLVRYRPAKEEPYASIGYAVLIYVGTKLFREGSYFSPEMYFFIWAYVFSSVRYRRRAHPQLTSTAPPSSPVVERAA
jgi:O-antigen ligase